MLILMYTYIYISPTLSPMGCWGHWCIKPTWLLGSPTLGYIRVGLVASCAPKKPDTYGPWPLDHKFWAGRVKTWVSGFYVVLKDDSNTIILGHVHKML